MMGFHDSINEGYAKKTFPDIIKARSLIKAANEAIATASRIPVEPATCKTIIRELYEGLRQHCEAVGLIKGYAFESHEVITHFMHDILHLTRVSERFDRYRKLRHGINYYGHDIAPETAKEALKEVPQLVKELEAFEPKHEKVM